MSDEKKTIAEKVRAFERRSGRSVDSWPEESENTAAVLNERRSLTEPMPDGEARSQMASHSRRSFLAAALAGIAGIGGWKLLSDEARTALYQRWFGVNERVSRAFYSNSRLAPEFDPSQVSPPRVNGALGMESDLDYSSWRLAVGGLAGRSDDLILTLDDIKRLPRVEMTTELKCIEGWSIVVGWAGARVSDFIEAYPPAKIAGALPPYVSIMTPDNGYFVGWDIESIVHPQTLLAYEMNGEPLRPEHGAPLRIAATAKYGIKLIKRIGRIEFTSERPRDYWAGSGYDWYSGH
jgi:DMSO/TMAO reductase YedYZ molybdopterin-dependent catalytic subunit